MTTKRACKMNEVDAIKDPHDIERISREFAGLYGYKAKAMWDLGLQLALRISDLLKVKYSDIENGRLILIESKTKKIANIKLNGKAINVIQKLKSENPNDFYLFQANGNRVTEIKPMSRQYVTKCFQEVGSSLKLNLGTHSMRKTRGYHLYKKRGDITKVMKMLRHSSQATTLRYIGITQEDIDEDFDALEL